MAVTEDQWRGFRCTLVQNFQPVLVLLWPEQPLDPEGDAGRLVEFFWSRRVWRWDMLGVFDADHFVLRKGDCDVLRSQEIVGKLGYICRFICYCGPRALIDLKVRFGNDTPRIIHRIESAVAQYVTKHRLWGIEKFNKKGLDVSMGGLRSLSLVQARRLFLRQLAKLDFWNLPFEETQRTHWMRQGTLHLLDQFPVLAAEPVRAEKNYKLYPYAYLMWGGFGKDVVEHVRRIYPKALDRDIQNNEHMKFLKLQNSRTSSPLPFEVIQTLLQANSTLLQSTPDVYGNRCSMLLELALRQGYGADVLGFILEHSPSEIDCLRLLENEGNPVELGEEQVRALTILLPFLKSLTSHTSWSIQGECFLLHNLTQCCKQNNNLNSLDLSISPSSMYHSDHVRKFLRNLVANLNESLQTVKLRMWDSPKLQRGLQPTCLAQACEAALGAIADGIYNTKQYRMETLTLRGFHLPSSQALELLLSQDLVGFLNMQLDSVRDMCGTLTKPFQGRPFLDRLDLYDCSLSDEGHALYSWKNLWDCISRLQSLESIVLVPRHRYVDPSWVPYALGCLAQLPQLRQLELGPHSSTHLHDIDSVDITDPLVALLHGSLEKLQIHGAGGQYRIQVPGFCAALKENKSLLCLILKGVILEGKQVTKSIFQALQSSNNVTLEEALIYDNKYFYTPMPLHSLRRSKGQFKHFNYENYGSAEKILQLCDSNLCGRRNVQKKTAKVSELAHFLGMVRANINMDGNDLDVLDIIEIAEVPRGTPIEQLDELYRLIRKAPVLCCDAVERAHNALSIQFTLLRDNPGLWCHAGTLAGQLPRKRQRGE